MRTKKATGWHYVADVESDSEPGVKHVIKRREVDGHVGCDCLAYRFKKGEKTCKHVQALLGLSAAINHHQPSTPLPQVRVEGMQHEYRIAHAGDTFTVTRRAISLGPLSAADLR